MINEDDTGVEKPIIYAYCDTKTDISIELQAKGNLIFSKSFKKFKLTFNFKKKEFQ